MAQQLQHEVAKSDKGLLALAMCSAFFSGDQ